MNEVEMTITALDTYEHILDMDPMRWWRRFLIGCARAAIAEARRAFSRGDDSGIVIGVAMLVHAAAHRDAAHALRLPR